LYGVQIWGPIISRIVFTFRYLRDIFPPDIYGRSDMIFRYMILKHSRFWYDRRLQYRQSMQPRPKWILIWFCIMLTDYLCWLRKLFLCGFFTEGYMSDLKSNFLYYVSSRCWIFFSIRSGSNSALSEGLTMGPKIRVHDSIILCPCIWIRHWYSRKWDPANFLYFILSYVWLPTSGRYARVIGMGLRINIRSVI
jgi:hypothetical protein